MHGKRHRGRFQFNQIKQSKRTFTPSRLFIYYNERVIEGTRHGRRDDSRRHQECREGRRCHETLWPYDIAKFRKSRRGYTEALKHRAIVYRRLDQTLQQLKGCLAQGYPFVFGFSVYESFESEAVAKTGKMPMPQPNEQLLGGHAVLAVGYDDREQAFPGAQLVGPGLGDGGLLHHALRLSPRPSTRGDLWTIYTVEEPA